MKKLLIAMCIALASMVSNAQTQDTTTTATVSVDTSKFKCDQLVKDMAMWEVLSKLSEDSMPKAIKDSALYKLNVGGELEAKYVLESGKKHSISDLKKATIDFLNLNFALSSRALSKLQKSEGNSLYLKASITPIAAIFYSALSQGEVNADIIFHMSIQENKVTLTMTIPGYWYMASYLKMTKSVKDCPPYNPYGESRLGNKFNALYKKAYVNSCSKILNYANQYVLYLNEVVK